VTHPLLPSRLVWSQQSLR